MISYMSNRPVIAAIPNYNMGASLGVLLPQILTQGYDAVYVLDDWSTDNSVHIVKQFKGVQVIAGTKNLGASGNRNRIFEITRQWSTNAIIHFLDADVRLVSKGNPGIIRRLFNDPSIGVVGGLVLERELQQPYNFGPRLSLVSFFTSLPQHWAYRVSRNYRRAKPSKLPRASRRWPDIFATPIAKDTYWVLEGNMCIPASTLQAIDGFHPFMRYHEAQDLGDKITAAGLRVRFDPSLIVEHLAIDVRGARRSRELWSGLLPLIRKNGLRLK